MPGDVVNFIFIWIMHMVQYCQLPLSEAVQAVITAANEIIRLHNETGGKVSTYSGDRHMSDNQLVFSTMLIKGQRYTPISDFDIRRFRYLAGEKERYLGEFCGIKK
jgi:hypothetical protein